MARLSLLGGPAEEIPCIVLERDQRYEYASLLRPWYALPLPREISRAMIVDGTNAIRRHPNYPFGIVTFARRIPAAVCRQLDLEEVR